LLVINAPREDCIDDEPKDRQQEVIVSLESVGVLDIYANVWVGSEKT
jgi:hypothetical protein